MSPNEEAHRCTINVGIIPLYAAGEGKCVTFPFPRFPFEQLKWYRNKRNSERRKSERQNKNTESPNTKMCS